MNKTYHPKKVERETHTLDAQGVSLGRLATKIATLLMGKHKADYSPHMDNGDKVKVVNAQKIRLTGNKAAQKMYYSHSGYPGGFKEVTFEKMNKEHPERVIELAVKRMLPSNRLRDKRMRRLEVTK